MPGNARLMSELERNVRYPEIRDIINDEWEQLEKRVGDEVSLKKMVQLAGGTESGLNVTGLHKFRKGEKRPNRTEAQSLAKVLFDKLADSQSLQSSFVKAMQEATETQILPNFDPYNAIVEKGRPLRVGIVDFGIISGRPNAFANLLLDRFAAFAGLRADGTQGLNQVLNLTDIPRMLCADGAIDIAVGIFATPDRVKGMAFLQLPILIPVNAVALISKSKAIKQAKSIAPTVTNEKDLFSIGVEQIRASICKSLTSRSQDTASFLRPIVNSMEVGGQHAKNFLGLSNPDRFVEVEYNAAKYLSALKFESSVVVGDTNVICLADEHMCFEILKEARKTSSNDEVIALVEQGESCSLPRYWLSLAVNRKSQRWTEYLNEVFQLYMDSNTSLLVSQFEDFHNALLNANRSDEPGSYTDRIKLWLGLNTRSPEQFVRRSSACYVWYSIFHTMMCSKNVQQKKAETDNDF
jgi:hypothetical protein